MKNEKQILNELGDTQRGKDALGRYVLAREAGIHKRKMSRDSGEKAIVTHMKNLFRDGPSEERFRRAEAAVAMVANDNAAIRRYTKGVDRARSILGWRSRYVQETNMKNEKQILNELGDTMKGKMALARYLNARMGHREKLKQEAQRMLDLGRRHTANFERGYAPPSERTIQAYSNMVDSLARRKIRYEKGMERAAAALMTQILQENNSMTIKEHYKEVLNERLFNAANPLGKIETGIRKLIKPTDERAVKNTRDAARVAVRTRNRLATQSGGRVPSARDVESDIANQRRDIAWQNYLASQRTNPRFTKIDPHPFPTAGPYAGWYPHGGKPRLKEESNLLNEIGDTERGQKALRAYIAGRSQGIEGLESENRRIDSSIRQVTNRLRDETTNTDQERQRGMQLVNMERNNKRKIGRYKTGIDRALARIRPTHAG